MHMHAYGTDHTTCQARQDTRLSELKPTMLASSVQAVVACNTTVPRVCTLVLFIEPLIVINPYSQVVKTLGN